MSSTPAPRTGGRRGPGRVVRALVVTVVVAVAVVVLFTWVFPWVEERTQDPTIGLGDGSVEVVHAAAGQVLRAPR